MYKIFTLEISFKKFILAYHTEKCVLAHFKNEKNGYLITLSNQNNLKLVCKIMNKIHPDNTSSIKGVPKSFHAIPIFPNLTKWSNIRFFFFILGHTKIFRTRPSIHLIILTVSSFFPFAWNSWYKSGILAWGSESLLCVHSVSPSPLLIL